MKPTLPALADVQALPRLQQFIMPPAYRDENDHVNVRHYMAMFDEAGYPMVALFGITPSFHSQHGTGGFDLEHHLHYVNEIRIGETAAVHLRVLNRTAKRIHYMMFLVNESRQNIAATFECVNAFADLTQRKTAPYPPEIAARIDALCVPHQALAWEAPMCGIMSA